MKRPWIDLIVVLAILAAVILDDPLEVRDTGTVKRNWVALDVATRTSGRAEFLAVS